MASFKLGNYAVKEVIYGVATTFDGDLLYTLDQLTSAQIEVSSDPTEITDKFGNTIRQIYNNKKATFTASSALCSPVLLNAGSGSAIQKASATAKIEMPKIVTVAAGRNGTNTLDISDAILSTVQVMGIYNNGANGEVLTKTNNPSDVVYDEANGHYYYAIDSTTGQSGTVNTLYVPERATNAPTTYLVKYQRNTEKGIALKNLSTEFPKTVTLTLYVAVMDPCNEDYRAGYIVIPSFTPDPSVTISFDSENQEVDFNGNVNLDFCGEDKVLYYIYFPEENAVTTAQ